MDLPLLCIPLALVTVYAPRTVVAREMAKQPEGYNNDNPRAQQMKLTGLGARASSAHANGFEAFPAFAIGVLAAHATHPTSNVAVLLSVAFVALRVIYIALFLADVATLRSLIWGGGFLATFGLYAVSLGMF